MTQDRWRQLEELYHEALSLPPAERAALLDRADPELRAAVATILAQENTTPASGISLDRPAWVGRESLLETGTLATAGTLFGPYRIEEQIGRGGMGEVFRATDTRLNRTVAIKLSQVHFTERFEREARVIASLNHPHIATLYDVGSTASGLGYLVLEYVEGPTLAELIARGPVPAAEVQRIATQTAEAIEAAHEKGIVHRDLKPANIKLTKDNSVKVLDFGLAKAIQDVQSTLPGTTTQQGVIIGTPCYMSPEQALGKPVDRRSDIWSFGVLFAEMLTGRRVFSGESSTEILAAVVRDEPDLSRIPAPWLPLLRRCLTKDIRRRLQAIGEARVALEEGLPSQPASARRRVLWPWALLASLLCFAAVTLWNSHASGLAFDNPLANATFTPLTDYEGTETDASISPDGKFVAFLSDRTGLSHVWLDQVGAGSPVDLTPGAGDERGPLRSIGFSRHGTEIWLSGTEKRRLQMLPLLGGTPRLFLGGKIVNPIWSPDGAKLAYHTLDAGDPIFVADPDGSNPRQILRSTPDKHNHYLTWSADGKWIYFIHGTPATPDMDLYRIAVSGGTPQRLTYQDTEMRDPVAFGKDTMLYLDKERDGSGPSIWAFDLSHHVPRRIAFGLERYTSLSAASDGRRLAVTAANPAVRLWSVPITGGVANESAVKPFPPDSRRALTPRLRGNTVYYLSSLGTGDHLWRYEAGKSSEIWGGAEGGLAEPPAISPDGRRIAVVARQAGKRRLRLITSDGTESSVIAPDFEADGSADWSPDGHWIVVGGSDAKGDGLFKIPVDGGAPVRLTARIGRNPVWSPDGSLIVYAGPNIFTLTPLLAVHPDGSSVNLPDISPQRDGERFRFLPDGHSLVYMQSGEATPWQDFYVLDLRTMRTRRLTQFTERATMRSFDITADGRQIVFDRERENSNVVLIDAQVSR